MPDTVADEAQTDTPAAASKRSAAAVAANAEEMASTALGISEHHSSQLAALTERLDALQSAFQSGLPEAVGAEVSKIAAKFQEWAEAADTRLAALEEDRGSHGRVLDSNGRLLDSLIESAQNLDRRLGDVAQAQAEQATALDDALRATYPGDATTAEGPGRRPGVPGVYARVMALMTAVGHIGRDRLHEGGKGGPKFMFRGVDDAMDAVGHAMREVGLVMETRILDKTYTHSEARNSSGNTLLWTTCSLTVEYTFIDPADGSRQTFQMVGEGRDSSDKATSKAASMALKYGLFQTLMIPVNGLDDSDTENPQVAREPAQQRQAQPRPEDLSPEDRARNALTALRALPRYPLMEQVAKFNDIRRRIDAAGIGHVMVEDARLDAWVQSVAATLVRPGTESDSPPKSHDDAFGEPEHPGGYYG
jgi:hypothetical protein